MTRKLRLESDSELIIEIDISNTADNIGEEYDPSFGIVENPSLEEQLQGVPGKGVIRGRDMPRLEEEIEDTYEYLRERVPPEAFDEIGVINPFSEGDLPRTFVLGFLDSERTEVVEGIELEYKNVVEVHYDGSWSESRVYADSYHPEEFVLQE